MVPTPAHPTRRYGLGAVNGHTRETVVRTRRRQRRQEVAARLTALLARHPRERVYCELFENIQALLRATVECFARYNCLPEPVRSTIYRRTSGLTPGESQGDEERPPRRRGSFTLATSRTRYLTIRRAAGRRGSRR